MFTGLVQATGTVDEVREAPAGRALAIRAPEWIAAHAALPPLERGESIAMDGCCLTLARCDARAGLLGFDVIPETLRKTTLSHWGPGRRVNIERSATPSTLLGGHIVQGHVDAVGSVVAVLRGDEWRIRVAIAPPWRAYLAPQGSIAVDGTSLTVAAIDDAASTFDVCLIPETLARTTLADRDAGAPVNIEFDCLAKMVQRALHPALSSEAMPPGRRRGVGP